MPELHPSDERLVDLALNDVSGRDQDALSAHLAQCESCRLRYARIADSVDGVLAAAPSIAPPPGFTSSVLAALGIDPARPRPHRAGEDQAPAQGGVHPGARPSAVDASGPGATAGNASAAIGSSTPSAGAAVHQASPRDDGRDPARRRLVLVGLVAAVVALLAGAIGTALVMQSVTPDAPETTLAGSPFVTAQGETVGSVQTARYEGARVLVISVMGPPGATYDCRAVLADGTQETLASWTLPPDGSAAWVVDVPEGARVTQMDLVAPSGRVWASAHL